MAIPTVRVPPGTTQLKVAFHIGNADGGGCAMYLWSPDGRSKTTLGEVRMPVGEFLIPLTTSIIGYTLEWDIVIFSYTGQTNEPYSATIVVMANGSMISSFPETGNFTKVVNIRNGAQFT